MVYDTIANAERYAGFSEKIAAGLKVIPEYTDREPGRYEINGDEMFILVQSYTSKPVSESKWEAHRKYIDIQYIADGCEYIGYADKNDMTVTVAYDEKKDAELYSGDGVLLPCAPGNFIIFFASEPHMPCVMKKNPSQVKKLVVKIKV